MEFKIINYNKWDLSLKKEVLYEYAWSVQSSIDRLCPKEEREVKFPILDFLYERSIKDAGRLQVTKDPIEVLNIEGRLDGLKALIPLLEELKNES